MGDTSGLATTTGEMIKNAHWKIQYARFFNFPQSPSTTTTCSFLRPIFRGKKDRLMGTWLPSSSSDVSLHILSFGDSFPEPTLVVSLDESIYEEHYISKLNFTWPHGSSVSGCALRKSRVIFASYRDGMSQIQKFALRFSSSTESQKFMESLKCLKEGRNFSSGLPQCVFIEGIDEEHRPLRGPSIVQEHGPYSCPEQAVQGHVVGGTDVALPRSFTALLADSCTETDLGVPQVPTEVDLNSFCKEKRGADKSLDMVDLMDTVVIGMGGSLAI